MDTGCSHLLATANHAALNMGIRVSASMQSLVQITRSGIAGSNGNSMVNFFEELFSIMSAAVPFYIATSNAHSYQHLFTGCRLSFICLITAILWV